MRLRWGSQPWFQSMWRITSWKKSAAEIARSLDRSVIGCAVFEHRPHRHGFVRVTPPPVSDSEKRNSCLCATLSACGTAIVLGRLTKSRERLCCDQRHLNEIGEGRGGCLHDAHPTGSRRERLARGCQATPLKH